MAVVINVDAQKMRLIGHFTSDKDARTFGDFLYVQGIETEFEHEDGRYQVWVKSDDDLGRASKLMEEFRANPTDPKFQAGSPAERLREMQKAEETAYRGRVVSGKQLFPGLSNYGFGFITYALIVGCVIVFFLSRMGDDKAWLKPLFIAEHYGKLYFLKEVRQGEIWRLVTPIFIHFGPLHILFNMMLLRDLGSLMEARLGRLYFLLFVIATGVVSNYVQYSVTRNPGFGGMSGVDYALVGYCWLRGRMDPGSGISLNKQAWIEALIWFVACFTIFRSFIANYAHAGGLLMGLAWAFVDSKRKFRLKD
jgi:GlpG protein